MSTRHICMSGSTKVHKRLRRPCMPEYGSESRTLCIYACICIYKACEKCFSIELDVMRVIETDLIAVWIFYSFNSVFISSYIFKMFWKLIGLLSNYHNRKCSNNSKSCSFIYQSQNLTYSQTKQIVWDMSLMTMAYTPN